MDDLESWWTTTYKDMPSAQRMWDSWKAPHRSAIEIVMTLMHDEIHSLYEVGCGAGPNLRMLQTIHRDCDLTLGGSEPAEGLRLWASEHLGITVDNLSLPDVPDQPWDATLSCYTLAYCDLDAATETLRRLKDVSKYLIIMEPSAHVRPYKDAGMYSHGEGSIPAFAHDYPRLLTETGWTLRWRWPLIPHIDGLNTVIVAHQES